MQSWLRTYAEYTKDSEAPSIFHLWSGISVVAAALERKVWVRLMYENIYPNMYIILVAPPGRCRKSSAISIGTRILGKVEGVCLSSERITPEALIQDMESAESCFYMKNRVFSHCSLTTVSKELGTFMSVNPEGMLKLLTDLFDSQVHDLWTYATKGSGVNRITGVWFNLLAATVPTFFSSRQIQESIGLGFTSRCVFVFADTPRRRSLHCDDSLGRELLRKLETIHELKGEFKFDEEANEFYEDWYLNLPQEPITIEALAPYYERKHVHALKLSVILSAAEGGNNMKITKQNVMSALTMLEAAEKAMPRVFGGTGRSALVQDHERIAFQIERSKEPMTEAQILRANYMHVNMDEVKMILETLVAMKEIRCEGLVGGELRYTFRGEGRKE